VDNNQFAHFNNQGTPEHEFRIILQAIAHGYDLKALALWMRRSKANNVEEWALAA